MYYTEILRISSRNSLYVDIVTIFVLIDYKDRTQAIHINNIYTILYIIYTSYWRYFILEYLGDEPHTSTIY